MIIAIGVTASVQSMDDISGSRDPTGIKRFPRASIVEYRFELQPLPYEFVTAPVDKIRRDVRIKGIRVDGSLERVTYRMPGGTRFGDVIAHYERQVTKISPGVVFSCTGLDCGRSTIWANDVFGVSELSSPNRSQFYLAAPISLNGKTQLVAVYVVQRGNRRVYAHIDVVIPNREVFFNANRVIAESLMRTGFAVVDGVIPDPDGFLDAIQLEGLNKLAETLTPFAGEVIYVICHLNGTKKVRELTEASQRCAEIAAQNIKGAAGVDTEAFGVGPLVPDDGVAKSRIELVLPNRLSRE